MRKPRIAPIPSTTIPRRNAGSLSYSPNLLVVLGMVSGIAGMT